MVTWHSSRISFSATASEFFAMIAAGNACRLLKRTRLLLISTKVSAWCCTSVFPIMRHGSSLMSPRSMAASYRCCPSITAYFLRLVFRQTMSAPHAAQLKLSLMDLMFFWLSFDFVVR
jgi:hypothetical protein